MNLYIVFLLFITAAADGWQNGKKYHSITDMFIISSANSSATSEKFCWNRCALFFFSTSST